MSGMRGYSPEESRQHLAGAFKGLFWIAVGGVVLIGIVQIITR